MAPGSFVARYNALFILGMSIHITVLLRNLFSLVAKYPIFPENEVISHFEDTTVLLAHLTHENKLLQVLSQITLAGCVVRFTGNFNKKNSFSKFKKVG